MRCSRCRREAVLVQHYSGLALCAGHLRDDVEARARKEIRAEGGIRQGDRIAVALSARPESLTLAHFLCRTFACRRDLSLLAVDGGSGGSSRLPAAEAAARSLGMEWIPVPEGERRGSQARAPEVSVDAARRAGATVLASGECLDELAGRVLAQVFMGGVPAGNRQGIPGLRTLTPFRRIPREEIHRYSEAIGVTWENAPCREAGDDREEMATALLLDHASRHPSAPHALLRLWDSLPVIDEEAGHGEWDTPGGKGGRGYGQDLAPPDISPREDTFHIRERIHQI